MRKPGVPRDLLDPIVEYFTPPRATVFGSPARGEATRDSDIDLLVVVDDDTPAEKLTWRRHERAETDHFRRFPHAELVARDKINLDIFWLKDDTLDDPDLL